MIATNAPDDDASPQRAWRWPLIVVGLLVFCVLTQVVLIVVAVSDPRQHVEPDYYAKGLNWDAHLAEQRASAELGWSVHSELVPIADGARILQVRVHDPDGNPVRNASVRATLRHRAALAQAIASDCSETEPGTYAGAVSLRRAGHYELALEILCGDARYVSTEDLQTLGGLR